MLNEFNQYIHRPDRESGKETAVINSKGYRQKDPVEDLRSFDQPNPKGKQETLWINEFISHSVGRLQTDLLH